MSSETCANDRIVSFNARKTDTMLISRRRPPISQPPLVFQSHHLNNVHHKHLGILLRSDLKWTKIHQSAQNS